MGWAPIHKQLGQLTVAPNLLDYEAARASFSWESLHRELSGLPAGRGLNLVYEAVDRHANTLWRNHLAIRWLGRDGAVRDFTYGDLHEQSNRFANILDAFGICKGDRVFGLSERIPELYFVALGTLKHTSVFCPLFSAFGPEPIHQRLGLGDAKLLVTTQRQYERKVAQLRSTLPELKFVLLADIGEDVSDDVLSLPRLLNEASPCSTIPATDPEDMAFLHFTSGTTGMPKGAIHVHSAVYMHYMTGKYALDLHPEDVYWCTADPGWVTGTSYGISAPLCHGVTSIVDEAEFDAERWYQNLEREQVTVWYTAADAARPGTA